MSGGYFDFEQHLIHGMADSIQYVVDSNSENYSEETLDKFKQAIETANKAAKMIQRIDWLLSCDDSEETFHERWIEDGL